ncbi:MAG: hypothetical protein WA996_18500 [Candidatus Promineifilaceae bacterium]
MSFNQRWFVLMARGHSRSFLGMKQQDCWQAFLAYWLPSGSWLAAQEYSYGRPSAPEPMAFLRDRVEVSAHMWGVCLTCCRQAAVVQLESGKQPSAGGWLPVAGN